MLNLLSTMSMRCPACSKTQHVKLRSLDPMLTRCLSCDTYLNIFPKLQEKPNNVLLSMDVVAVDYAKHNSDKSGSSSTVVELVAC